MDFGDQAFEAIVLVHHRRVFRNGLQNIDTSFQLNCREWQLVGMCRTRSANRRRLSSVRFHDCLSSSRSKWDGSDLHRHLQPPQGDALHYTTIPYMLLPHRRLRRLQQTRSYNPIKGSRRFGTYSCKRLTSQGRCIVWNLAGFTLASTCLGMALEKIGWVGFAPTPSALQGDVLHYTTTPLLLFAISPFASTATNEIV